MPKILMSSNELVGLSQEFLILAPFLVFCLTHPRVFGCQSFTGGCNPVVCPTSTCNDTNRSDTRGVSIDTKWEWVDGACVRKGVSFT